MRFWIIGLGIVGAVAVVWVFRMIMTPAPGTRMEDQGREHVAIAQSEAFAYNSNPPTSGPHNKDWVRAGIYDTTQHDALLIHSLEHGYVIISYNCNVHLKDISRQTSVVRRVFAHEEEATVSAQSTDQSGKTGGPYIEGRGFYPGGLYPYEATESAVTDTGECKDLIKNLEELARKKKLWKLIVVPRPQLDTTIALTAWNYIDKFDEFDAKRIESFIDYHRDHGPEKTME